MIVCGQHTLSAQTGRCVKFRQHRKGVYDFRWGGRDIRLIVTSQVALKKSNALWLMFGTIKENIENGVANYQGRMDEMSSTINQLLIKYNTEGIIAMPYTVEDYRKELKENVINSLTSDELKHSVLNRLTLDEILEKYSPDEIKAYLESLKKNDKMPPG